MIRLAFILEILDGGLDDVITVEKETDEPGSSTDPDLLFEPGFSSPSSFSCDLSIGRLCFSAQVVRFVGIHCRNQKKTQ
ncbi:hypothetical protein ACFX2F_028048 [Malus domestica]